MSVTIPQTRPVRPGNGHWRPSLKYKNKTSLTDRGMATGLKKTHSVRLWYGLWHSGTKCVWKKSRSDRPWCGHCGKKKPGLTDWGVATRVTKFHMASDGIIKLNCHLRPFCTLLDVLFSIYNTWNFTYWFSFIFSKKNPLTEYYPSQDVRRKLARRFCQGFLGHPEPRVLVFRLLSCFWLLVNAQGWAVPRGHRPRELQNASGYPRAATHTFADMSWAAMRTSPEELVSKSYVYWCGFSCNLSPFLLIGRNPLTPKFEDRVWIFRKLHWELRSAFKILPLRTWNTSTALFLWGHWNSNALPDNRSLSCRMSRAARASDTAIWEAFPVKPRYYPATLFLVIQSRGTTDEPSNQDGADGEAPP